MGEGLVELKAKAYDCLLTIEMYQKELLRINQEISRILEVEAKAGMENGIPE